MVKRVFLLARSGEGLDLCSIDQDQGDYDVALTVALPNIPCESHKLDQEMIRLISAYSEAIEKALLLAEALHASCVDYLLSEGDECRTH